MPNCSLRAQRGDIDAYEEIVQRYQQLAFRTAYVITGSAAEAEEAAQDGVRQGLPGPGHASARAPSRGRGSCASSPTRRATGSVPPAQPASGAPAGRRLPPGGCGPIPRGGGRRRRTSGAG